LVIEVTQGGHSFSWGWDDSDLQLRLAAVRMVTLKTAG
jgi:hypothetical protein